MSTTAQTVHPSPLGTLTLAASESGLTKCSLRSPKTHPDQADLPSPTALRWLELARHELDEYFAGRLRTFTVPVDLSRVDGPHRRILAALGDVGHGETTTYGAMAAALGLTVDGPRQVGAAMARNPVMIILGCHRVLGVGRRLVGYAAGLEVKQRLLDLEVHDRALPLDLVW